MVLYQVLFSTVVYCDVRYCSDMSCRAGLLAVPQVLYVSVSNIKFQVLLCTINSPVQYLYQKVTFFCTVPVPEDDILV